MDRYNERCVKGKMSGMDIFLFGGAIAILVAAIICALFVDLFLGFLIALIFIPAIIYTKDLLKVEYEYILTNGDVDIAKVYNNKRRRESLAIHEDSITKLDYGDSERTKNDKDIGTDIKWFNYCGKEIEGREVAVYFELNSKKCVALLDLDDKCIDHMKEVLKNRSEIK